MFHWNRTRWVILPLLALLLATSKPLATKELTGSAEEIPDGLSITEEPTAVFGENVNNQGCFADQRLDLRVHAHVRNDGDQDVTIREGDAQILIDGREQPLEPHTYSIGGERSVIPFEDYVIAPGDETEVTVYSYSFMPADDFDTVDRIEVSLPVGDQHLRLVFSEVRSVETEMR